MPFTYLKVKNNNKMKLTSSALNGLENKGPNFR
jgi:hypothetical protein